MMHFTNVFGLCFALLSGQIASFNVDTNTPVFLEYPQPQGSEESFGYSVLLENGKAFVGAPVKGVNFI